MFGVRQIDMIVQIALSLRAVTCNLHNYFCMAELLPYCIFWHFVNDTLCTVTILGGIECGEKEM